MGTLRTLFALSVFFDHARPGSPLLVGGQYAVQLFYVISGFLISYVLVERRTYANVTNFYVNRYLRLYPIYVVVALITLAALLATHRAGFITVFREAPVSATVLLVLSNLLLFGQDWIMFLGVQAHHLTFVKHFTDSDVLLFEGLITHQTWTLGVELTFYVIAPFVLPRRNLIFVLLAMSVGLRIYLMYIGLGFQDPWTYRFFPAELALFLAGALSHQLLLPLYRRLRESTQHRLAIVATAFMIFVAVAYFLVPVPQAVKLSVLFGSFIVLVPLTFLFQNFHPLDAWIGNLSYPIYVGHILVFRVLGIVAERLKITDATTLLVLGTIAVIGFAVLLDRGVAQPFESVRKRLRKPGKRSTPLNEKDLQASRSTAG
jgi:peptidoglycan/LPS O-acetylase OafA/YrhL